MANWTEVYDYLQPKAPLYCPEEPSLTQKVFLRSTALEAFFGGAAGGGKLALTEHNVSTPFGWRKLKDIHPGDLVFGQDGKPYLVEAESDIQTVNGWNLTFDDGSEVVAHDDHLWLTYNASELEALTRRSPEFRAKRRATRPSRKQASPKNASVQTMTLERNKANNPSKPLAAPTGTVRTTREIVETLTIRNGRANHAIPVAKPLQLPEKSLPIDPYLLGAWLGDGSKAAGSLTGMDQPIHDAFASKYAPGKKQIKPNNKAWTITYKGLRTDLREMGVLNNKHIPHDYLWASEKQRLALLQGLMDTDGNIVKGTASVEFVNTNQNLTEGVAHLARSLGMKVQIRKGRAKLYGEDYGPKWSVKFAPNRIVFRLPRKANTQSIATRRTTKFRYIKSAERIHNQEMKCLKVSSPDNLFLITNNLIPTHNSSALLQAGLQYVDVPGYTGIFFRRTYADLALPGALMDRFIEWVKPYDDVHWNGNTFTATFPSGARITFGYLNNVNDRLRYKSAEFQYIAMDEVTEIRETDYRYLFSRLRRPNTGPASQIPLRMRAASNPAPNWVRQRFVVEGDEKNRVFVKSLLSDNPGVDHVAYRRSLQEVDPIERQRLEFGDWWAASDGSMFKREDFEIIESENLPTLHNPKLLRYWDMAGSEPTNTHPDPDWTVGTLMMLNEGIAYILDVERFRLAGHTKETRLKQIAIQDGTHVEIAMEQEPGSSGKDLVDYYSRNTFLGFNFSGKPSTGDKVTRAGPYASAVANGNVKLVRGPWITDFLDEHASFPEAVTHDDQVDSATGAYNKLTGLGTKSRSAVRIIV